MQDEKPSTTQSSWFRQAPLTVIGVLVLGIVGSTLYDLLVKPGLTSFGRLVLDVITLGSTTLRNAAYSSAALDPTPVSALVLLQAAMFLAVFPALRMITKSISDRGRDSIERKFPDVPEMERKAKLLSELSKLKRKVRILAFAFWLLFIPWIIALYIALLVHNQSVVVWRVFNANLAILGPKITPDEKLTLQAKFASMESGDDYKVIREQMQKLANSRNIKLKNIETW